MNYLLSILLFLFISNSAFSKQFKIIYGEDDRQEVQNCSPTIQKMATGVATSTEYSIFTEQGNFLQYEYRNLMNYRICFDEPFAKQTLLGDCSGFLIAKDIILTAGHCVPNLKSCQDRSWIFDHNLSQSEKTKVLKSNTYKCKRVLNKVEDDKLEIDYALIQLDRPTKNNHIFIVRNNTSLKKGTAIGMIGHPVGLPKKFAGPTTVSNITYATHFTAKIDAFGGNSGSPVFELATNEVIGILTGGAMDFDDTVHQCKKSVVCTEGDTSRLCKKGETILRTSQVKIPTVLRKLRKSYESPLLRAMSKNKRITNDLLNQKNLKKTYFGWTPLQQAILNKDIGLIKRLIKAKADLDQHSNYDKHSALLISLITEQYLISELLINEGANLNLQEKSSGETAIMMAIYKKQNDLAIKMAKKGADLTIKSHDGHNAHDFADFEGDFDLMKALKDIEKMR